MNNDKTVTMSRELAERVCARLADTGQFLLSEEFHAAINNPVPSADSEVERLNGMLDASSELLRTKQRVNRELRSELERIKTINDNNFKIVLDRLFEPAAPEPVTVEPTAWIKPDVAATLRGDECCYAFGEQNPKGSLIPLYAAPVKWRLPDPCGKQSNLKDTQYAMGWNACLDKVKELNQ